MLETYLLALCVQVSLRIVNKLTKQTMLNKVVFNIDVFSECEQSAIMQFVKIHNGKFDNNLVGSKIYDKRLNKFYIYWYKGYESEYYSY